MTTGAHEAAVAFTYAWWLTGDAASAEQAVRAAVSTERVLAGPADERLGRLLRAVRARAAPTRTMCPASELALLHDAQGVPLDLAASISVIEPSDAGGELAHGRLEALLETVREPFDHPERLGGLAVGNPRDVAHARQCPSCARARGLLLEGRRQLSLLPRLEAPADLLRLWGEPVEGPDAPDLRGRGGRRAGRAATAGAEAPAAAPSEDDAPAAGSPAAPGSPAVPGSAAAAPATESSPHPPAASVAETDEAQVAPAAAPADLPQREHDVRVLVGGSLVAAALVLVLVAVGALSRDPAGVPTAATTATPTQQPTTVVTAPEEPPPTDSEPLPTDSLGVVQPDVDFRIASVGVLTADAEEPVPSGVTITPPEPIRFAVSYEGAATGVALLAVWTVDGEPFEELLVVLASTQATHVFGAEVPPGGWPVGDHVVTLVVEEQPVAEIRFRVA